MFQKLNNKDNSFFNFITVTVFIFASLFQSLTYASDAEKEQAGLSKSTYGKELATEVADNLKLKSLMKNHYGYCGAGFEYINGTYFYYGDVEEGSGYDVVKKFDKQADFIDWLSNESDFSLGFCSKSKEDGVVCDNQRISKSRLVEFNNIFQSDDRIEETK